jgi:hypothetical protein
MKLCVEVLNIAELCAIEYYAQRPTTEILD